MTEQRPSTWRVAAAALAVVALAAFFRLHQIDTVPYGLFIDEAQNGLDAWSIRQGETFPVFVEAGNVEGRGREPMLHYLMAGMFRMRGPSVPSIRLTVASIGIVTIACFFLLGERLFGLRVAFVSSALLAMSRWHVTMSRVGVRAILVPLFLILVLLALRRLVERRTIGSALLFGAAVGAGFYTYPAFWVVPAVLLVILTLMCWFGWAQWRGSDLWLLLTATIAFLAVTAPLLGYAVANPDSFFARASDLSIDLRTGADPWTTLRDHLQRELFMLHFRGDGSPMYNIPGRPFLDPLTGVAFVIGLFLIVKDLPRRPVVHGAVLCLWLVPLIPGAVTTAGAWGMRSIGSMPAIFLIAGVGLSRLTRKPVPWLSAPRWVSAALLTAALAVVGTLNYRTYFYEWANDPGVQGSYTTDVVRFFDFCADLAGENDVYLSPYVYNAPNVRFLELERPAGLRLLDDPDDLTAEDPNARARVFVSDSAQVTDLIKRMYPGYTEIGRYSKWGRGGGVVLRVPASDLETHLSPEQQVEAEYWIGRMHAEFEAIAESW